MNASERDSLTGLANRRGFNRAVRTLIDEHPDIPFVLIYGDMDRFKVFNDRFGTEEGDKLLATIGSKIASVLPPLSAVARLRSDHFVCCLPQSECDPEGALALVDGWLKAYPVDFSFFVRLGVYDIDDPSLDVSLMTDRALMALHEAKTALQTSNLVRYNESMRDTVVKEQELVGEMAAALEARQFELYFQPQYQYSTGAMVGAEVLVRWNHPEKGLIAPGEFIPVFERKGIVSDLDYYIWSEACRCLRAWLDAAGPGNEDLVPRLSVNLSRSDVYRADLCEYLVSLIRENGIPRHLLHLEITEGSYMEDPYQLTATVRLLQQAGFIVEMDDFGSGYSSLNALKDVPVDVLKLDLQFLDARNDTRGGVILASVVRMARWLDLPVIAEGVEFETQVAFLSSIGCDMMQGFLFSRPVDRSTFEQMFRQVEHGRLSCDAMVRSREDFSQFWDAESLVGLVFNSYVGPAALAEFDGSHFEVVRANDGFLKLLHLPLNRFARTVDEVFGQLSETDSEKLHKALANATSEVAASTCELRVRGRGADFWVRANIHLLTQITGASSFLVVLEETTEIQTLRDRLYAAMEGVPGGLGFYQIKRGRATMLDFNDASAELVGLSREEYACVCGDDPLALVEPDDRWIVSAGVDQLRDGALRAEGTIRVRRADNSICWLSFSASLTDRGEDAAYFVAALQDVTKDKERDLRLRYLAEQQQQLYESIPCGIIRYTADENPQMESANRMAWTMLGCANYAEFLAYLADDVFSPLDTEGRGDMRRMVKSLLDGAPPIAFSSRIHCKDGSIRLIEGVSALATTSDGTAIVQSAFNDVTEARRAHHRREMQRFTSVLCGVYAEVFEFDTVRDTYQLCCSSHASDEPTRPFPFEDALGRWFSHVPAQSDRDAIRAVLERCRTEPLEDPLSIVYRCDVGNGPVWYESTFVRASDTSVLCCNNDVSERLNAEDERLSRRLNDIMENLPVGIGVYDLDNEGVHLRYVSDTVFTLMEAELGDMEAISKSSAIVSSDEAQMFLEQLQEGWWDYSVEREIMRYDQPFTARVQGRAVRRDEESVRIYAVIADVSNEVRERRERAWENERYRMLSELTHSISFDYNSESDTVLLYIDHTGNGVEAQVIPEYLETLRSTREGVVHPDSMDAVRGMFERARAGAKNEILEYRADYYGTGYQWYRTNLFVVHDEGGAWHLVGLIENIQAERELRVLAEHDAITGLSNNASTRSLIDAALSDPHACAHSVCAVIDLDNFKNVNDTFGHLRGDELLQQVGVILRASCREHDVVGRVGGDEFVVFLKNINLEVAARKLAHMKRSVAHICLLGKPGESFNPTLSIGATPTHVGDAVYRDVFARADKALYQAKRAGKNRLRICR